MTMYSSLCSLTAVTKVLMLWDSPLQHRLLLVLLITLLSYMRSFFACVRTTLTFGEVKISSIFYPTPSMRSFLHSWRTQLFFYPFKKQEHHKALSVLAKVWITLFEIAPPMGHVNHVSFQLHPVHLSSFSFSSVKSERKIVFRSCSNHQASILSVFKNLNYRIYIYIYIYIYNCFNFCFKINMWQKSCWNETIHVTITIFDSLCRKITPLSKFFINYDLFLVSFLY